MDTNYFIEDQMRSEVLENILKLAMFLSQWWTDGLMDGIFNQEQDETDEINPKVLEQSFEQNKD